MSGLDRSPVTLDNSPDLVRKGSALIPRLLVSVRDQDEAALAIAGGCDILDIKNPQNGSLGMASREVWAQVDAACRSMAPEMPLSAALGEAVEWSPGDRLTIPPHFSFVKLGCANLGRHSDWKGHLAGLRQRLLSAESSPSWIGVAYADWQSAAAPTIQEMLEESLRSGCRGLLIDTWSKQGRSLLDWVTLDELHRIGSQLRADGRLLALAGSLRLKDLSPLQQIPVDVIAVRGAVCQQSQRTAAICQQQVAEFRQAIHEVWASR